MKSPFKAHSKYLAGMVSFEAHDTGMLLLLFPLNKCRETRSSEVMN